MNENYEYERELESERERRRAEKEKKQELYWIEEIVEQDGLVPEGESNDLLQG